MPNAASFSFRGLKLPTASCSGTLNMRKRQQVGFHAASLGLGVLQVLVWSGHGWSWALLQGNGGGWSSSPLLVSNGVVGSCGRHCRVVVVDGGHGLLPILCSGGGQSWASSQGNGGGWWSSPLLVSNGVVGGCGCHCRVVVVEGHHGLLLILNGGGGS